MSGKLSCALDLSDAIKEALGVFGLQWKDRNKIKIHIDGDRIIFRYLFSDYTVTVSGEEKP